MSEGTFARAIVAYDEHDWRMEEVKPREIQDDELLVQMIASGICHTDIVNVGSVTSRVLGHEGSGIVKAIGRNVEVAKVGDPVLLSFNYCKACSMCHGGHPAYCYRFAEFNFIGDSHSFSDTKKADVKYGGCYFGQSSFASLSIVKQASVVNAKDLIKHEDDLKLFAPLGCGIQTGSGAVLNIAKATKADTVAVIGLGGVGLAGIMAAKMIGCKQIIAVDLVDSRINLAKDLGATHGINSKKLEAGQSLPKAVQDLTGGSGVSICVDTTGIPALISQAVDSCDNRGRTVMVGAAPTFESAMEINMTTFMLSGKQILACIEGDMVPSEYVPEMVSWYRKGVFPIDKLVKFFKASEYEEARKGMEDGSTIKPILIW